MGCEHKNLKTVNDMLICKDCGQQLPMSFLADRGKGKGKDKTPASAVQPETPSDAEKQAENQPVESQTNKSTPEKKPRKNAKKGA